MIERFSWASRVGTGPAVGRRRKRPHSSPGGGVPSDSGGSGGGSGSGDTGGGGGGGSTGGGGTGGGTGGGGNTDPLILNLDARYALGNGVSLPADGTLLSTWKDLSTYGNDVTNAVTNATPLLRTANPNKLSYNQSMIAVDLTGLDTQANCSITRSFPAIAFPVMRVTATAASTGTRAGVVKTANRIPVVGGTEYTALVSSKALTTPRAFSARISWYSDSGYLSSSIGTPVNDATDVWTQASVTATAPATATKAEIIWNVDASAGIGAGEQHDVKYLAFWEGSSTTFLPPVHLPGGAPVVQFTNDWLHTDALDGLAGPFTVYVYANMDAAFSEGSVDQDLVATWGAGAPSLELGVDAATWNTQFGPSYVAGPAFPTDGTSHIISAVYDGASSKIRIDGGTDSTGDTGTLNVTGINLGMRNDLTKSWRGSIIAVRVYREAHSNAKRSEVEADIAAGTVTPPVSDLPQVTPDWSDSFVDSMGTGTQFHFTGSYENDEVVDLLVELGIRKIRDRQTPSDVADTAGLTRLYACGAAGIKIHATLGAISSYPYTNANMDTMLGPILAHPTYYCSVGGFNEPNDTTAGAYTYGSDWATKCYNHQKLISDRMAANGISTDDVKRGGPSLKDAEAGLQADFATLGATGIGTYMDYADFHRYPLSKGGTTPSSQVDQRLSWARAAFPGLPNTWTEFGFATTDSTLSLGWTGVPWSIQSIYIRKAYCEAWWRGIVQSFQFRFMDDAEANPRDELQANWGFVYVPAGSDYTPANWVRKDSFNDLKAFIADLEDPGSAYTPRATGLRLTGTTTDMRWFVLQKRNGTNKLVIWRDVQLWNKSSKSIISITPVTVTVESDAAGTQTVSVADDVYVVDL